jgi:hypothetical protein
LRSEVQPHRRAAEPHRRVKVADFLVPFSSKPQCVDPTGDERAVGDVSLHVVGLNQLEAVYVQTRPIPQVVDRRSTPGDGDDSDTTDVVSTFK